MKNRSKIQNLKSKIAIVGAGPAGTSLAIRLAKADFEVILIEREKFPRQKLCGEFISPECLAHFRDLEVFGEMLLVGGDRITETVFYEPNGKSVSIPSKWLSGNSQGALSISRAEMDFRLLEKAKNLGVKVLEETSAIDILMENGEVCGVKAKNKSSEVFEISADLTIDATGRAGVLSKILKRKFQISDFKFQKFTEKSAQEFNGKSPGNNENTEKTVLSTRIENRKPKTKDQRPKIKDQKPKTKDQRPKIKNRLVGFKAHLKNVEMKKGVCEIYFFRGGYGGLSFVEKGAANHCFLIKADVVKEFGGDADKIIENIVLKNKRAFETLKNAEIISDWLAVSVDEFGTKELCPAPNLLNVGDASAFIDPFTGSGMLMALEGAEILARVISEKSLVSEQIAEKYKVLHTEKFRKRLRVCSIMRRAAFSPVFAKIAISALSLNAKFGEILAKSTRKTFPFSEIKE